VQALTHNDRIDRSNGTGSIALMRGALYVAIAVSFIGCFQSAPTRERDSVRERPFRVGDGPGVIALIDANRDGIPDIVVANERSATMSVLLGDGKGGFAAAPGSPIAAGPSPNDIAVGDFNGDGWPDVALANHDTQQLTLLLGGEGGRFRPAVPSRIPVAVKPHPHGVAAGDFDGDGSLDLATDSWAENRLEILVNNGDGAFRAPGSYVAVGQHPYQRIRSADLNRDGHADIVSPNLDGNNVTILLGNGKGAFTQPSGSPFSCGDSPFNVAVGDVNGDGFVDLAIVNSPSSASNHVGRDGLAVLLGDGQGRFRMAKGSPLDTEPFPNMVAIGDIDGDNVGDIVVSNPESDSITIFFMARDGSVKSRKKIDVPGHPKGLIVCDFDYDGKGDIAVANNKDNTVTVLFGN
jgi:FG-GAP-like repeat